MTAPFFWDRDSNPLAGYNQQPCDSSAVACTVPFSEATPLDLYLYVAPAPQLLGDVPFTVRFSAPARGLCQFSKSHSFMNHV